MERLLFASDNIEAIDYVGDSDYLIVSFAPKNVVPDGSNFWLKEVAEQLSLNVLGIVPRTSSWYPAEDMAALAKAATARLASYSRVITIGQSMGGFAALKYGWLLRATHTMAFAPQISIDPDDVGGFDQRFTRNYNAELNQGMALTAGDMTDFTTVFYDPYDREDAEHVRRITALWPGVQTVRVPWTAHFAIWAFRGTEAMQGALEMCLADDIDGLRRAALARRRELPVRFKATLERVAQRNPALAEALLDTREDLLGPKFTPGVRAMVEQAKNG